MMYKERCYGSIAAVAALLITAFGSGAVSAPRRQEAKAQDPWMPLQFLVGKWSGGGSGKPGDTSGATAEFAFELDKKILVKRNRAEFPPKPGEAKGAIHEDLTIIYPQAGSAPFRADYFDNEGHVIHYQVTIPSPGSARFESEPTDKAPRFRLTYEKTADGVVATDFLIAPPGGEFKSYIKGAMQRK